jgi:hypothetical protein
MAHTPTPWHVQTGRPFDYPSPSGNRPNHCIIGVGDGRLSNPFHHVADAGIAESDEVQANARLIVRAVNSHAALVEALENYMSQFGQALAAHGITLGPEQREADEKARAALALAQKE